MTKTSPETRPKEPKSTWSDNSGEIPETASENSILKKLAIEFYKAKEYPADQFAGALESASEISGRFAICGDIIVKEMFSPFNDLFSGIDELAAKMPYAEGFIIENVYSFTNDGDEYTDSDVGLWGVGFSCKDEAEAKDVFKLSFSEVMEESLRESENEDEIKGNLKYLIESDRVLLNLANYEYYAYYRVGKAVYVLGTYINDEADISSVKDPIDYKSELERFCKGLGVLSPTSLKVS